MPPSNFFAVSRMQTLARLMVGLGLCLGLAGMASGMDLQQAYEAALENDATIRAARAGAAAGRERLPQAKSQLRPNVSLSMGRNYNDLTSEGKNLLGQRTTNQVNYFSSNQTISVRQPL